MNLKKPGVYICAAAAACAAWAALQRPTAEAMADAARNFLAALDPGQSAKAKIRFEDEERFNFHFIPRQRKGLPLGEMRPEQHHLAHALLAAGLSREGLTRALTVMSLEEILRVMEKDSGERRNPGRYYFSIFGEPSAEGVWGYRVEGHHLSLNYTLSGGRISAGPTFFGSNPAEVRQGPRQGLRALAREEDLGRALMMSFDDGQKRTALVSRTAYKDILTGASRKAALAGQPSGLPASKMTGEQYRLLEALVAEYAGLMPPEVAAARMERFRRAAKKVNFAWAGVEERGGPHYYRVQGPDFLIEYDNTQNGANHIHSVWRDLNDDFGEDLLKRHYETSPHHKHE